VMRTSFIVRSPYGADGRTYFKRTSCCEAIKLQIEFANWPYWKRDEGVLS
jgi:hypothetical protein